MPRLTRRACIQTLGAAALAQTAGPEFHITSVSPHTVRISSPSVPDDGALVRQSWGAPLAVLRPGFPSRTVKAGGLLILASSDPLSFTIQTAGGQTIRKLTLDAATGALTFATGSVPLFGLGEGGPQFDRRGDKDAMRSGQGGYQLRTHGGRVPIPWILGADGWALFVHAPLGAFDFSGPESRFTPAAANLPLDLFFSVSADPAILMAEYARITGLPELPALWTFGYQQSHRTLASRDEILQEAKTFREKKLPCDTLIYLGTGFCPSGWNTDNGKFGFNQKVFPDPKAMFDQLHQDHFKVVLHVAYPTGIHEMKGTSADACDPGIRAETQPSCYWDMHRPVLNQGVDGWWPDEGDALNGPSRLVRNRMYWEAPQIDRPNQRPYALHRNGYPGMQRYGSFLWSGDVSSLWETLRAHVPIAINTSLSGMPYWGTDIGGFVPTRELTGELYVRWFQFGSFNPLFRSHGRTWKLRLPWGWNTGETGPVETANVPLDPQELHNAAVEPICRKYLELRYRLLPYLYSTVREATFTGMPVIRGLWLHYPKNPAAVARGDEYLWGPNLLVAPVTEQGAKERKLYLPEGVWHDFWTDRRIEGGAEITRPVDLETTPLYVRAGSVIPLGPVKQYTAEPVDAATTLRIYPGADSTFLLYEDDGESFNYRKGQWMGIRLDWNDARRTLSLRLEPNSRFLGARRFEGVLGGVAKPLTFEGRALAVRW
ncbi:MAG TPA: TIM-barrel domain-containing protein [Candidatus Sulfopaludibacter sp.]|jgi:alpha-glucosidase/alpha-D-xyloside xylohydrolase|nr:TIM-barrel domain-containing protein [Candidatus Sulfopaludibacter sp.]